MDKHYTLTACASILALASTQALAASNFTISPFGTLPTTVTPGNTVQAFFTITNNTSATRSGYTIQGLPSTVTQNTTVNHCATPITLASHGSCILQLDITGAVNAKFALCKSFNCTTSSVALNVTSPTTPVTGGNLIVAGGYSTSGNISYPLLALSQNHGTAWNYVVSSATPLPSDYVDAQKAPLQSASCAGVNCIAAGNYITNLSVNYPLIMTSNDKGITWASTLISSTPTTPGNFDHTDGFVSASCSTNSCIASGSYYNNSSRSFPLVATSTNNGVTWSYTIDNTTPTPPVDFDNNGDLNAASCNGNTCVVAGNYNSLSTFGLPLIATSADAGLTWAYTVTGSTPTKPGNFDNNGTLNSVSCFGNNCSAAGGYNDSGNTTFPWVATSTDNGLNWAYTLTSSTPIPIFDYDASSKGLSSISCSSLSCVTVGVYQSTNTTNYPMAATSVDGGVTWAYTIANGISTLPADFLDFYDLPAVSCDGTTCVAAGTYTSVNTKRYAIIATSNDAGLTWTYTLSKTSTAVPGNFDEGGLLGINCQGTTCIASGAYQNALSTSYPLVFTSTDHGLTWVNSISSSNPAVPSDFENGLLSSPASTSTSLLLPDSLKWLYKNH